MLNYYVKIPWQFVYNSFEIIKNDSIATYISNKSALKFISCKLDTTDIFFFEYSKLFL